MPRKLTLNERKFVLKSYWKYENAQIVINMWNATFETPPPTRLTIYQIRDKFEKTGSVSDTKRSGRPLTANNLENQNLVAQALQMSPTKSTRHCSLQLGISRGSLINIIRELKMKPYRPRLLHGLLEDDPDRRLQFAEIFISQAMDYPEILDQIIWSDEAQFKLSGYVNRHNSVYWSSVNPHITIKSQLNKPGVTVWAGISSSGIMGPIFFEGIVTGAIYLNALRNTIVPQLQLRDDFQTLYFQQDGAPPHFSLAVRNYLDEIFKQKWIGRRGPIEFPPRSPDLTPMDFSVWGIVKDLVYVKKPLSLGDLKQFISEAFHDIDANKDLCRKICRSVLSRCEECSKAEGNQFEHRR